MKFQLSKYREAILAKSHISCLAPELLIEQSGRLSCHYAPFEHVNTSAKVVLMGMTPGAQQANNGLESLASALRSGKDDATALSIAKAAASFSGPMRNTLVQLLDRVGLQHRLGLASCAELFANRTDLVHYTSALRYPVFMEGANYQGTPGILRTPFLQQMTQRWLAEEVRVLSGALWIPLGKEAKEVLRTFVNAGLLSADQCLDGLPHPSGANAERHAYFLGQKPRHALSAKTNPDDLDARFSRLLRQVGGQPSTPVATVVEVQAPVTPAAAPVTSRATEAAGVQRAHRSTSETVRQAEAEIRAQFEPIAAGTDKLAGYQTRKGRHLAIDRKVQGIQVWTEDLPSPPAIGKVEVYVEDCGRHSNLGAQAPRLAKGHRALCWKLHPEELSKLLTWYATA